MKLIQDEVDIEQYPYVVPFTLKEPTPWGDVWVARGFLSDGASGVIDLCREAFTVHDALYLFGQIHGIPLKRWQVDVIYGLILWRYRRPIFALIRPVGLLLLGRKAWKKHRAAQAENPDTWWIGRFVPKEESWLFPSWHTKDAVWVGA